MHRFAAVDGTSRIAVMHALNESGLRFHKLHSNSLGALACWLTKFNALREQVSRQIPYQVILEDDLMVRDTFRGFAGHLVRTLFEERTAARRVDVVALGRWGEGYLTSLASAERVVSRLLLNGVQKSIDTQRRLLRAGGAAAPELRAVLVLPAAQQGADRCDQTAALEHCGAASVRRLHAAVGLRGAQLGVGQLLGLPRARGRARGEPAPAIAQLGVADAALLLGQLRAPAPQLLAQRAVPAGAGRARGAGEDSGVERLVWMTSILTSAQWRHTVRVELSARL